MNHMIHNRLMGGGSPTSQDSVVALIDTKEAAAQLGVSPKTLCKLRTTGGGPRYVKILALVRYDPADLAAWAASRKQSSTSDNNGGAR